MYKFSLIVPTINRKTELKRLFHSLVQSSYKDFEVIVVDQNRTPVIDSLCAEYASFFPLVHLKVDFTGAARARNFGAVFARGEILAFPDDDGEYPPGLLEEVIKLFDTEAVDIVFGRTIDKTGNTSTVTNFSQEGQKVTVRNIYRTTVEFTMFIKKEVFFDVGFFNETLGVGTPYGAEEGADFVLRALYLHKKARYYPVLTLYHPENFRLYDKSDFRKAFSYGMGFGRLTALHVVDYKNLYQAYRFFKFQFKTFCAVFIYIILFNSRKSRYYFNIFTGRWVGLIKSLWEFIFPAYKISGRTGV